VAVIFREVGAKLIYLVVVALSRRKGRSREGLKGAAKLFSLSVRQILTVASHSSGNGKTGPRGGVAVLLGWALASSAVRAVRADRTLAGLFAV
jgi:hypothetical protein